MNINQFHATTILALRHKNSTVFIGDGQVTFNNTVFKHGANKIRKLEITADKPVLAGFAGSAADAFTLFEKFEVTLKSFNNQLGRAAVELAKEWRSDKMLRKLEAMMIVGDRDSIYMLSGNGDVISPDDNVMAIGSGGMFALSAARALVRSSQSDKMSALEIAELAMNIAAEVCPFTNTNFNIQELSE